MYLKHYGERMRKSSLVFWYGAFCITLLAAAFAHATIRRGQCSESLRRKAEIVRRFELTDLCLFTEARYTRHPSQADLHAPFQDHPLSLEHFPSGSLVIPPHRRQETHAEMD
jgi:hypothetical protein